MPDDANPPPVPLLPTESISVTVSGERNGSRHSRYVQDLAVTLFDRTLPLHNLSDNSRHVLSMAALLHDLPYPHEGSNPLKATKHLIELEALEEPTLEETETLAIVLALYRGKIRSKGLAKYAPEAEQHRQVLTLTGLLSIAAGLDHSHSQSTAIQSIEPFLGETWLIVSGPQADGDAAAAQMAVHWWRKADYPKFYILDEGAAARERLPFPDRAKTTGIQPDDNLAEAGRKVMRFQFAEMLSQEDGTRLGEDIEALHDMRVATRRLRAAFEVFGSAFDSKALKPHLRGLRAIGQALGKVRDLDVFMEKARAYLDCLPEDHLHDLDPMLQVWEAQRQTARAALLAHLDSLAYQKFKHRFNIFVQTPGAGATPIHADQSNDSRATARIGAAPIPTLVKEIAPLLIYQRLAVVRSYDRHLPDASVQRLHALRIEFKQLRYTIEYFREVLGEESRWVINEIKKLQDHLGDLHDAFVACGILQDFINSGVHQQSGIDEVELSFPHGVAIYLEYRRQEFQSLKELFPAAWADFNGPEFRTCLSQAVSIL